MRIGDLSAEFFKQVLEGEGSSGVRGPAITATPPPPPPGNGAAIYRKRKVMNWKCDCRFRFPKTLRLPMVQDLSNLVLLARMQTHTRARSSVVVCCMLLDVCVAEF